MPSCRRTGLLQRLLTQRLLYLAFPANFSLVRRWQRGAEGASLCRWRSVSVALRGVRAEPPRWMAAAQRPHGPVGAAHAPARSASARFSRVFSLLNLLFASVYPGEAELGRCFPSVSEHRCCRFSRSRGPGRPVRRGRVPGVGHAAARSSSARCLSGRT